MPFPTPNLDDRSIKDLVAQAIEAAHRACPQWTDRSPGDPLIALLEASAFLTDLLVYRVNRMPEKAYAAFLNLIGAAIGPPAAAVANVRFTRKKDAKGAIELPAGTRIKAGGAGTTFVLAQAVKMAAGEDSVEARALHCEVVEGERLGLSTGVPGQIYKLARAPVIANPGDGLDIIIGVEADGDLPPNARSRELGGKAYHLWQEVDAFTSPDANAASYICDRYEGRVMFAAATEQTAAADARSRALARVPPAGREIRAWYRFGGGAGGNVAAHMLNAIDGANPGVDVDNPERAAGVGMPSRCNPR